MIKSVGVALLALIAFILVFALFLTMPLLVLLLGLGLLAAMAGKGRQDRSQDEAPGPTAHQPATGEPTDVRQTAAVPQGPR